MSCMICDDSVIYQEGQSENNRHAKIGRNEAFTDFKVPMASNKVRESFTYSYSAEQDFCPLFIVMSTISGL